MAPVLALELPTFLTCDIFSLAAALERAWLVSSSMCLPQGIHFGHCEDKVIATPNLKQAADLDLGPEVTLSVSKNSRV